MFILTLFTKIQGVEGKVSAHTQHTLISDSFGVVKFGSLRREGRRGWKGRVKNGVRMKHMITL